MDKKIVTYKKAKIIMSILPFEKKEKYFLFLKKAVKYHRINVDIKIPEVEKRFGTSYIIHDSHDLESSKEEVIRQIKNYIDHVRIMTVSKEDAAKVNIVEI